MVKYLLSQFLQGLYTTDSFAGKEVFINLYINHFQ